MGKRGVKGGNNGGVSKSGKGNGCGRGFEPEAVEFINGLEFELGVALLRGAFTPAECQVVHQTPTFPGSVPIADRDASLEFNHNVWRIEGSQDHWQSVYDKAQHYIREVDHLYWRQLPKQKQVHPEVEFIDYTVQPGLERPGIGPHVDNSSVITMVAMMTPRDSYRGGESCFELQPGDTEECRTLGLELGDAVFFRGELCEHWITPVENGRRCILQIEMCKAKKGRH